ncbi:hypothetical protein SDC9_151952 [bioreactor metagenome]|uniref:Uncharacterized protein n=1 Tax=bioreactor metagenome TaxID=1076179 RepID=A0A645ESA5_9ZZZZ
MYDMSLIYGTPWSLLSVNPANEESDEAKLAGSDTRSKQFTMRTSSFDVFDLKTDKISEGKLSPPSFNAAILKL